ncbi:MAG TPA: ABC transporter permease [Polyangiales bacterium]|nr:ABC transporter permease [Polyangiales bacterium]
MTAASQGVDRNSLGPFRVISSASRTGNGQRISRKRPMYRLAIGPLLLLVLWCIASATGVLSPRVLSAPWTVVATGVQLIEDGRLPAHLATSARRVLIGLAAGTFTGVLLALISGLSQLGEALIDGPVQIKRSLPTLALIPLFILWLGIGEPMKLLTIALASMVPVYVHTHGGLRSIDARYVELAESLRLGRWEFIRKIALPGALPGFMMGLRLALTSAWLSLVVVEQINATSGVGYMISLARSYGQTEIILVGLAVYGVLGLTTDTLVRFVEGKALSWRRTLAG